MQPARTSNGEAGITAARGQAIIPLSFSPARRDFTTRRAGPLLFAENIAFSVGCGNAGQTGFFPRPCSIFLGWRLPRGHLRPRKAMGGLASKRWPLRAVRADP